MWHGCGHEHAPIGPPGAVIRSGSMPAEKFEVPGSRVSGLRSPLVSTVTELALFIPAVFVKLQGRGFPGKETLALSSSFRGFLVFTDFTGMKVKRALTARGATKLPPPSCVRWMLIVVTRCGPSRET